MQPVEEKKTTELLVYLDLGLSNSGGVECERSN